jgi:hypothetical protein
MTQAQIHHLQRDKARASAILARAIDSLIQSQGASNSATNTTTSKPRAYKYG